MTEDRTLENLARIKSGKHLVCPQIYKEQALLFMADQAKYNNGKKEEKRIQEKDNYHFAS